MFELLLCSVQPTPWPHETSGPPDALVQLHHADNCSSCLIAVIKPIYGAASIGVVRVNNMAELKKTYKKVVKEMAGARIVAGALQQADASDDDEPADGSAKPVRQEVSSGFLGNFCGSPGSVQYLCYVCQEFSFTLPAWGSTFA